jgi:hypothetical protein
MKENDKEKQQETGASNQNKETEQVKPGKEQLYRWVKASERLPEETKMIFIRNVESKAGGMVYKSDLVKMDNKQNVEWLEPISSEASGDEEKDKEIRRLKILLEVTKKQHLVLYHKPAAGFKLPEIWQMEVESGWQQFKTDNNL